MPYIVSAVWAGHYIATSRFPNCTHWTSLESSASLGCRRCTRLMEGPTCNVSSYKFRLINIYTYGDKMLAVSR